MGRGYRVGVDIGSTSADIVLQTLYGRVGTRKMAFSVGDYGRAIVEGLRGLLQEAGLPPSNVSHLAHGITVATNTILEHRGARTGLLTTRAFRHVLEMRRVRAPTLYTPYRPPPMMERRLRPEVDERVAVSGKVVRSLDEARLEGPLERFRWEGVEAVGVCLLHSYCNPTHERRVGEIVRQRLPSCYLSLSVNVLPEVREARFLAEEATLQLRSDKRRFPPYGLAGGRPGTPSLNILHPGPHERLLPTIGPTPIRRGDVLRHVMAGAVAGATRWSTTPP